MTVEKITAIFEVSNEFTEEFRKVLEGYGCDIVSLIVDPGADSKDYIVTKGYPRTIEALKNANLVSFGIRVVWN